MSTNEAATEEDAVADLLRRGPMSLAVLAAAADPSWKYKHKLIESEQKEFSLQSGLVFSTVQ